MDEEYRATYELIRAGKMPEAETIMGDLLNSLFAEDPDEKGHDFAAAVDSLCR